LITRRPLEVVRACFQAYLDKDRDAIEALIAENYKFTSPLDNALNRKAYFKICWPNNSTITDFDFIHEIEDGVRVVVVYEGHTQSGRAFRNTELHTVWDGKLVSTEVYFGWNLPHDAPKGKHLHKAHS
jgi:ketosteroid isomerase-like protein